MITRTDKKLAAPDLEDQGGFARNTCDMEKSYSGTGASTARPATASPAKSKALDDMIMATNNSSITSKRSVERLYYPDEQHFFRFFVKKFQRRAPLINRGYWLRLKAVDTVVRHFLEQHHQGKAVIINLGCGSDVLPWQFHSRHSNLCQHTLFVDVDYPELMRKKRSIVLETPQLRSILGTSFVTEEQDDAILLKSEHYCQIGCDLRDLQGLSVSLNKLIHLAGCPVLFVAEVSITYMDTQAADALIEWASCIGRSEFCLLEQLLPQGPTHPFAATMLDHFSKLNTPLKSILQYPKLSDQAKRFASRGFPSCKIWDLWEAWSSDDFVTNSERAFVDEVEPFDEWEEFVLFGRHYFIIHASSRNIEEASSPQNSEVLEFSDRSRQISVSVTKHDVPILKRRFGDALILTSPMGHKYAMNIMGLGSNGREEVCDVFGLDGERNCPSLPLTGPSPRMCHTATDLGDYGVLLVGGRASPASPLSDCWLLERSSTCQWKSTHCLPIPLFRHSAIRLRRTSLALIAGGKTGASTLSDDFFVFHAIKGWLRCRWADQKPTPTFGGILCETFDPESPEDVHTGLLSGGIRPDGKINRHIYIWQLKLEDPPVIRIKLCQTQIDPFGSLSVFGARVIGTAAQAVICGGVGLDARVMGQSISAVKGISWEQCAVQGTIDECNDHSLPFMVGSSILPVNDAVVVLGGGATCFSMGTYWQSGIFVLNIPGMAGPRGERKVHGPDALDILFAASRRLVSSTAKDTAPSIASHEPSRMGQIVTKQIETKAHFDNLLKKGEPVVIRGADIGQCVQKWTPSYLVERVGFETKVVIHESGQDTEKMDFTSRNFHYASERFGVVLDRATAGDKIYLRALSRDQPTQQPANIEKDFPGLASDFRLPEAMDYVRDHLFSSVLRVSGKINMWLHYDVMANLYVQVSGRRRMVLFPPSDVNRLAFAPGASSSSFDVFSELETQRVTGIHPFEAIVEPGDVLFLPPFWPHAAAPIADSSIAVNVFFRNLDKGYATGRDIYGNRDLAAYEKGRQDVARIGKSFQGIPLEARRFYLNRLADELASAAEGAFGDE